MVASMDPYPVGKVSAASLPCHSAIESSRRWCRAQFPLILRDPPDPTPYFSTVETMAFITSGFDDIPR